MEEATRHSSPVRTMLMATLSFMLVMSLIPSFAFAEEHSAQGSITEQLSTKNSEAMARFLRTGNVNDLRDFDAYTGGGRDVALQAANQPEAFDLRDAGVVTPVKVQNPWGTCWGFGAIAASETSILSELGLTTAEYDLDLSELHLAWFSYTPLPDDAGSQGGEGRHSTSPNPNTILDQGGFPFTATSVFSSGIGPLFESSVPYRSKEGITVDDPLGNPIYYSSDGDWSVDETLRFGQAIELEESCIFPSPAGRDDDGNYLYNEAGTSVIKQELLEGRAVAIGFCADQSMPGQADPPKYINTVTWAHYTYNLEAPGNHVVTIVGWDDTYSRENFLTGHRPDQDGAWIVKNSWGALDTFFPHRDPDGWGVDGNGYFYLSYYDMSLAFPESFDYYVENLDTAVDYYLVDQYDYMPSSGALSFVVDGPASMTNVFMAEERQLVRSLSCETVQPDVTVTYELYLLHDGYADPKDGELMASIEETYEYSGYHRVQIADGIEIGQDQHYAVAVTQRSGQGYQILLDRSLNREGLDFVNQSQEAGITIYSVGIVNRGESFLLDKGMDWTDLVDEVAEFKRMDAQEFGGTYFDYDNFPIKAYADPLPALAVVPDLSNMTDAEALTALQQLGLNGRAGIAEYSDTVEAGRVIRQDIAAGSEVEPGSVITYIISLGKGPGSGAEPLKPGAANAQYKPLAPTGDDSSQSASVLLVTILAGATTALGVARLRQQRRFRADAKPRG